MFKLLEKILTYFNLQLQHMYALLRKMMFTMEPERAHYFAMKYMGKISGSNLGKGLAGQLFSMHHPALEKSVFGLHFKNPVGLAAGFDKNATFLNVLQTLGFGFVEIGTVTPRPQPGNEKPRLFRLAADKALINRMGFNNEGAEIVRIRLDLFRAKENSNLVIGGNIGKNKVTPNEDAWKDYVFCLKTLYDAVDYFVVNVSSPNTPGLRALQEKDSLKKIFSELKNVSLQQKTQKPLLLKIAPDLTPTQLDEIIQLAEEVQLQGIVATNTTISRENLIASAAEVARAGDGGLSGKPLRERATAVVTYLSKQLPASIPIIASGGVMDADAAKEKLEAGASLVQVYTGFIYHGPALAKDICKALV